MIATVIVLLSLLTTFFFLGLVIQTYRFRKLHAKAKYWATNYVIDEFKLWSKEYALQYHTLEPEITVREDDNFKIVNIRTRRTPAKEETWLLSVLINFKDKKNMISFKKHEKELCGSFPSWSDDHHNWHIKPLVYESLGEHFPPYEVHELSAVA